MTSILHLESKPGTFKKAKLLKRDMTETEIILWKALRNRRLNGYKFRRQHPILRFIADFYCHEARLIVEIDGEIHDEFTQQDYDQGRSFELSNYGIKVIRFSDREIKYNLDEVLQRIQIEIDSILADGE